MATKRKTTRSRGKSYSARRKKSGGAYLYTLYAVCLIAGLILGAILFRYYAKNDGFSLPGSQTAAAAVYADSYDSSTLNERI